MTKFKFSVGPWNASEGGDRFGPSVRESIPIFEKISKFKEIGIDAMQFHDDDVIPEINNYSESDIIDKAREFKEKMDEIGIATEFIAPRLWEDPRTIDGAFTSNNKGDREYANWRLERSVDIARALGTKKINIWPAREGTVCYESKDPLKSIERIVSGINSILEYDKEILVMIEHKPNEPIDRSFIPTIGHSIALSYKTIDPDRVGVNLETAHAVLSGLDPSNEMAIALFFRKLWTVHLNDQNGIKYDQDKAFGVENLRQAFNQVRILVENNFGSNGEYIGLDVQPMRTQKIDGIYSAIENSIKIVKMLEEKVSKFDYEFQKKCIKDRDYEALELYVMKLLLNNK